MRTILITMTVLFLASPALAANAAPPSEVTYENDTYRFGYPYRSERGTTPDACAALCDQDGSCAAWSLTQATFKIGPRCELKRAPGSASHRPGAVSGMSSAWQRLAEQSGERQYQPGVPASRQPAAVPLDQLRPSPVPRTFGTPPPIATAPAAPPMIEMELLGGPATQISAEIRQTPPPARPALAERTALRGPGVRQVPDYVKQPATQPVLVNAVLRRAPAAAPAARPTPTPTPAPTVAIEIEQPTLVNAVAKRRPTPAVAQPIAPPPTRKRKPWTERMGTAPDYSVDESGFVPGDEQATAGFVDGAPENTD